MIIVPWLVGVSLAGGANVLDAARVVLGPAWLVGYLAFNAATLMTKAAPRRCRNYLRPVLVHSAVAATLGLLAIVLGGLSVLWWAVPGVVLVGVALLLTRRKRERSLLAGLVSIVAGTGVGVVARFWSPAQLSGASAEEVCVLLVTMAYFAGTLLVVKTMIRERGSRAWLVASVGYHAALLAGVGAVVGLGWLGWPWLVVAALCLARAMAEPRLAGRVSPLQIGLVEVVLSVLLLVAALVNPWV